MSAPEAAAAIARGVQRAAKSLNIEIETDELPLSDGGADFLDTLHPSFPRHQAEVTGPLGEMTKAPICVYWAGMRPSDWTSCLLWLLSLLAVGAIPLVLIFVRFPVGLYWALGFIAFAAFAWIAGNKFPQAQIPPEKRDAIAVLQLSSAAGLAQVPKDQRDPTRTTTYGVGQLILAALDQGARDITIGVGNSATVDAGAGALAALGVKFFDQRDRPIERPTGGDLARIARIDASSLDPRLKRTKITVACDVDNPLLGHDGAAPTFAPQKGATPEQVAELERGLANFVDVLRSAGFDPKPDATHTGAAGGFGFGLATVLGARLIPTIWLFTGYGWDEEFYPGPSLVLTGEGRLDAQTVRGKLPIAVAKEARKIGVPTIALVGSVGEGAEKCLDPAHASRPGGVSGGTDGGLLDYLVITPDGMPLDEALRRAPELLEAAAERAVREWLNSSPSPVGEGGSRPKGKRAG